MSSMKPRPNGDQSSPSNGDGKKPSKHARKEKEPHYILRRDLRQIRESWGLGVKEAAGEAVVSKNTLMAAEAGIEVSRKTAQAIAKFYRLEFWAILDQAVLPPAQPTGIHSWIVGEMGPVLTASNEIQWRVCELNHRFVKGLKRRGKLYDLRPFAHNARVWKEMEAHLSRHCEVCNRIGDHPNVARSYDVFPEEDHRAQWWVIDEWLDGVTLEERLADGPLPRKELLRCMKDIASGLQALHRAKVVRRELSPRFIYMSDGRAILTDFELAKLLDASPTVRPRGGWPDDPYRAKEVRGSDEPTPAWDLFSWGMILAHAASGKKPAGIDQGRRYILDAHLPSDVESFAVRCIGPAGRRPDSFAAVQPWFDSAR